MTTIALPWHLSCQVTKETEMSVRLRCDKKEKGEQQQNGRTT